MVEKSDIAMAVDEQVHLLDRHTPYQESDHILTIVYNLLTGGESLTDIERPRGQEGLKKLLGAARIPDPTSSGGFLAQSRRTL